MGKHPKEKAASEAVEASVIAHIKLFPTVESHYCRARTKIQYLDEHLTVAQMHRLNVMKEGNKASLSQYRDIFNTRFNLAFFKPKKDQCPDCLHWKNLTEPEKTNEASQKYNEHVNDKKVKILKEEDLKSS